MHWARYTLTTPSRLLILLLAVGAIVLAGIFDWDGDTGGIAGVFMFVGGVCVLVILFGWNWFWRGKAVVARRYESDPAFRAMLSDRVVFEVVADPDTEVAGEEPETGAHVRGAVHSGADVAAARQLLGVDAGADVAEINAAWRRCQQLVHPDRADADTVRDAQRFSAQLNAARDLLIGAIDTPA